MAAVAAVWHGKQEGFRLTRVPLPSLAAGEVLVRNRAVTLCGSDLHTVAGRRVTEVPTVLGHEVIGEILQTGGPIAAQDGTRLEPGMTITWTIGVSCGHCARCSRGFPQKCATLRKYGHARMTDSWRLSGGLASHCHLLAGTGIVVLPAGLDDGVTAPANCATATVVSAVRRLDPRPGETVLITGCGMLGLTAVSYLRSIGVSDVLACDVDPSRQALARALGATVAAPADLAQLLLDSTAGEGVATALDFSGNNTAIASALRLLAIGGRMGLVGSVFPTPGLDLVPETLVRRLLTIVGVHNYAAPDLAQAIQFLEQTTDRELLRSLVTGRYPLVQLADAIADARQNRSPRVMLVPEGD